jgi:hypothetical protein
MVRAPLTDELRFARMSGSSIAAPGAAGWVTDFLNAAYFARPAGRRSVDDLRLAHCILTTRWYDRGCRLGARDVVAFHRAFGARRVRTWPVGTLTRDGLLAGARAMLGDWFPDAVADDARRAHGIAFRTAADREAFDPGVRMRDAALGELTPPAAPPDEQQWSTYPPVPLPGDGEAALALLADPARWPDFAAEGGRFTALRRGGLEGQTFEIEVLAGGATRTPVATRGYVTATRVARGADAAAFARALADGFGEPVVPPDATPLLGLELTTHAGHFLGRARSNILAWREADGTASIRDVGCWDPLPYHLAVPYALAGRAAQHAFWGPEPAHTSMLAQLALVAGAAAA